jgi:hypothetical protein
MSNCTRAIPDRFFNARQAFIPVFKNCAADLYLLRGRSRNKVRYALLALVIEPAKLTGEQATFM